MALRVRWDLLVIVETEENLVIEVNVGREVRRALLDLLDRLVNGDLLAKL